ncbi:hypothetical protein Q1695_011643 [Nippostrongylus brasiliensis]|nr:hypothetical protein Q1695_011643 [Nippostrongylus brasiliensis]
MPTGLLAASDESDCGESERRPPRRRFFQKSDRSSRRFLLLDVSFCHCLLLSVLSLSLIYVAMNTYSLTKRYAELQEDFSRFSLMANRMDLVESGLNRLSIEFDLWRESGSNSSSRETTDYVYNVMKKLTLDVREMKKRVGLASRVVEDVTRRVSTVETRCLNVCRQSSASSSRERDKQRRRQAAKTMSSEDEIVFNRN